MQIIVASSNKSKLNEIRHYLMEFEILSLKDISYDDEIIEDGSSFYENALIKARAIHKLYPQSYILADDSGLEVDALSGRPGIYSARYAGENSTQEMLINKLLGELKDIPFPQRSARFVSMMLILTPQGNIHSALGECHGKIAFAPRGIDGFGYDPVFLPEVFQYSRTFAEVDLDIKNKISHRARALEQVKEIFKQLKGLSEE